MFPKIYLILILYFINNIECSPANLLFGTKPQTCPLNEKPVDCIEFCSPTCDRPKRPPCVFSCHPGCDCQEDYIRTTDYGKCVKIESCINPNEIQRNYTESCKENEIYHFCKVYEATCSMREVPESSNLWCEGGCICKDGFIRKENRGLCIAREKC